MRLAEPVPGLGVGWLRRLMRWGERLRLWGGRSASSDRRPAPTSPREFLLSFKDYDPDRGLDEFLSRFDFSGVTPHQVYYSVLGRLPESAQVSAIPAGYDPHQHVKAAVLSPEFQSNLIAHILRTFPEKQRMFFVHVPKCAGSDLASHLMDRYRDVYLGQMDQSPTHLFPVLVPWRLKVLMTHMLEREMIVVVGHIGLNWLLSERLMRFGDIAFAVIRDPIDMVLSKANYVLTMLHREPASHSPEVADWCRRLNLDEHARDLPADPEGLKQLALRLLRDPKVIRSNNLCGFLGRGTMPSALDLCAASNIELTTVSRYEAWLQQRWGVTASRRINESIKFIGREDLRGEDLEHALALTRDDQEFFERVERRLAETGRLSIGGASL